LFSRGGYTLLARSQSQIPLASLKLET